MVGLLLEHGARTDLYGGINDNSLQGASLYSDVATVQMLLDAGSDVNRKGGELGTALNAACKRDNIDLVRILLEHDADPGVQGCWVYDNALQTACDRENLDIVLLLLEHGADPNLHGGWHGSSLHAAFSQHGHEKTIRALLSKGADINYQGGEYCSILQAAVVGENEIAVKIALQCGLSPNEKGGYFTYPLLRAAATETCPDSIVRILLEAGADPNLEREGNDRADQTFRTALQHADTVSKATLLLDSGANVNTVAGWLDSALHAAIAVGGNEESSMIKLLVERGADIDRSAESIGPPLCYAARKGQLANSRLLIEASADLHSVDMGGHSPLHLVICSQNFSIKHFDYFVELGADPLLLDRRGCSGLHYAARVNNLDVVNRILKSEPHINATDGFGWTCLHWAASSIQESAQVIKVLIDEGCNKDLKDRDGRTALDLANKFNNTNSMAVLSGTANAHLELFRTDGFTAERALYFYCDGCGIVRTFFPLQG